VHVVECECHLHQPVADLGFGEEFALDLFDARVHVAVVALGHHDVQLLVAVQKRVLLGHDEGVPELLQQPDFLLGVVAVVGAHVSNLDLLNYIILVFMFVAGQIYTSKCATPD